MAGDGGNMAVSSAENWTTSPLYLAALDALAACGLDATAALKVTDPAKWDDHGDPEWPSPDPVVRLRFQMLWTANAQQRCGFDPKQQTSESTLKARGLLVTALPVEERGVGGNTTLDERDRAAIVARYLGHETGESLAECFEVDRATIYRTLAAAGVAVRPKWQHKADARRKNVERAVALFSENPDRDAIARTIGVARARVNEYLREAGVSFGRAA